MLYQPLHTGEIILDERKPVFRAFMKKVTFVFFVWFAFYLIPAIPLYLSQFWFAFSNGAPLIAPLYGLVVSLGTTVILTLFYMYVFDDFGGWFRARGDIWTATNQRLILYSDDAESIGHIGWNEVQQIKLHYFWAVRIRLKNRQAIVIRYIDKSRAFRDLMREQVAAYALFTQDELEFDV